jgi:hypothetical protein
VERPRRVVRFAIDAPACPRSWRASARAAYGGSLSLPWLPLNVIRHRMLAAIAVIDGI